MPAGATGQLPWGLVYPRVSRDWGDVDGSDMTRRATAGWETWMGLVWRLVETRTDSRTRSVDVLEISQALPASSGPAGHIAPVHIPPISGQSQAAG